MLWHLANRSWWAYMRYACTWQRPTWPKCPAISCYWSMDSAMYTFIKIYLPQCQMLALFISADFWKFFKGGQSWELMKYMWGEVKSSKLYIDTKVHIFIHVESNINIACMECIPTNPHPRLAGLVCSQGCSHHVHVVFPWCIQNNQSIWNLNFFMLPR